MTRPVNPAGSRFEHKTDAMTRRGINSGRIDAKEAYTLGHQDQAIQGRVHHDIATGKDPRTDPLLAKMQVGHRETTKQFLGFNPGQNGSGGAQQGQSNRPGGVQGHKGPVEFTDKDGNTVTKTPDGYTNVVSEDGNTQTTLTPGGYEITYDKENSSLTMKDTKSGESTSVWGDPHVSESDEGGDYWNYDSETSTFVLADGTKITTDATSAEGTLTDVNIYSGRGRTHIYSGQDGNSVTGDARRADAAKDDGDVYFGNLRANDWYSGSPRGEEVQVEGTGYDGLPYYES